MRLLIPLLCLLAVPLAAQQERPLPDKEAFLKEARKRLETDEDRQRGYVYTETRRQTKLDKAGKPQGGESVKVIESYPGFPGEERWERVIAEDGKPVPAAELAKGDRKRQEEAEKYQRDLAKQTDADRAKIAREREKERRDEQEIVEDVLRMYDFQLVGRETIDGHDAILFAMAPKNGVKARTRVGGMLRHFKGRVWLSESDHELVKLDVEAIDNLSFGLGLLARLHEGSRMTFQRRKLADGVWMPARATYTASARVLLLKRMRIGGTSEFSNYRSFSVDTSSTYAPPASP